MIELLADLLALEEKQTSFCMAVMIQSGGSTPRSAGSRMLVLPDGKICGSIGGGKLEAQVIEAAGEVIHTGVARILDFEFSGADAASLDMICGGNARILLEPVTPAAESLWTAAHAVETALQARGAVGWLVSEIGVDGQICHRYVEQPTEHPASAGLDARQRNRPTLVDQDGRLYFVDPLCAPNTVIIFGAGHVSRALASLARLVGFRTVVVDDRAEFANRARFPNCDELLVLDPIDAFFRQRSSRREDMLVIVTRGHMQDQIVLENALQSGAGYIGMIGSRRKRELIFQALREKGYSAEQLAGVHSPIGLSIGAETPEEIAVSITAELIQQRVALRGG